MKRYMLTMGGSEYGWSRHNDEGVHRDYDAEASRLLDSAKNWGIECIKLDNDYIKNWKHYNEDKDILQKPGFGFTFKAIGFCEVLKIMDDGDVALFVDSNHLVAKDPQMFYDFAEKNSIFVQDHIWLHFPNKDFTKRDTFVNMGCDEERYWNSLQMQCSIMGVCKNDFGVSFFKEYLEYCLNPKIMFGENKHPNFPTFRESRHNQSIFSIMVEKYKLPYIKRGKDTIWVEHIIPEIDFITPKTIVDNSYRKEEDEKYIR